MAEVSQITVEAEFKLGFDNSFSSVSLRHGRVVDLNSDDDEEEVRKKHKKELLKLCIDECVKAKKRYDVPKGTPIPK